MSYIYLAMRTGSCTSSSKLTCSLKILKDHNFQINSFLTLSSTLDRRSLFKQPRNTAFHRFPPNTSSFLRSIHRHSALLVNPVNPPALRDLSLFLVPQESWPIFIAHSPTTSSTGTQPMSLLEGIRCPWIRPLFLGRLTRSRSPSTCQLKDVRRRSTSRHSLQR